MEENMALGATFQNLRGGSLIRGELNSHRGRGELNSQSGLDSCVLPCFSAIVVFLWQYCY